MAALWLISWPLTDSLLYRDADFRRDYYPDSNCMGSRFAHYMGDPYSDYYFCTSAYHDQYPVVGIDWSCRFLLQVAHRFLERLTARKNFRKRDAGIPPANQRPSGVVQPVAAVTLAKYPWGNLYIRVTQRLYVGQLSDCVTSLMIWICLQHRPSWPLPERLGLSRIHQATCLSGSLDDFNSGISTYCLGFEPAIHWPRTNKNSSLWR